MKYLTSNNLRRIVYVIGGIAFIMMAIKDQQWWIGLFGLYFIAMAVFKFGCASDNCGPAGCDIEQDSSKNIDHKINN